MKAQPIYRIQMPHGFPLLPLPVALEFERHLQEIAEVSLDRRGDSQFEKDGYRISYSFDGITDTFIIRSVLRVLM